MLPPPLDGRAGNRSCSPLSDRGVACCPGSLIADMHDPRIQKLLHGFPFVLRDCPDAGTQDESAAVRLVSFDDGALEGRASSRFPQSLLLEAMAQTASLLTASGAGGPREGLLAGVSRARFGRPPRAGDRLRVSVRITQRHGDLIRVAGRVSEGAEVIAEGEIILAVAPDAAPDRARERQSRSDARTGPDPERTAVTPRSRSSGPMGRDSSQTPTTAVSGPNRQSSRGRPR
jgi:3-hydroxymyristoyl/3-hydroxydecanoyl-(acyl carrier protein) dehydratase